MSEKKIVPGFEALEKTLLEFLDSLDQPTKGEVIADLLHRLNFEGRLAALTPEELEHMSNESLSPEARDMLK